MNPDDVVLVALLNNPRDWDLVSHEHWYRIPVRHAPKFFSGAQYIAFYLSSRFRDSRWTIENYAPVRGHELARRRDLIPEEAEHPRADELYYKLQLGPLERRDRPIVSRRGRRILFLWTTWEKFSSAQELNDLFHKGESRDRLWEALKGFSLDVEREILVREGRSRYRVDFLIYCPRGRVAVTIGGKAPGGSARDLRTVQLSEEDLEDHLERSVDEIRSQTRELGQDYASSPPYASLAIAPSHRQASPA